MARVIGGSSVSGVVRRVVVCVFASAVVGVMGAAPALAAFGLQPHSFELSFLNEGGVPAVQAGSHPLGLTTSFKFNEKEGLLGEPVPDGSVRNVEAELPAGVVGNPTATPKCSIEQFNTPNPQEAFGLSGASCPNDSQVGVAQVEITPNGEGEPVPLTLGIYNLAAPPGVPGEFGFNPIGVAVILTPTVRTGSDYGVTVSSENTNQTLRVFGVKTTFWGVPSAHGHDGERGECLGGLGETYALGTEHPCPVEAANGGQPFLTLPTSCEGGPLSATIHATAWAEGGVEPEGVSEVAFDHDSGGHLLGVTGCGRLSFNPTVSVHPTSEAAASPTGFEAEVAVPQNEAPNGLAEADLKSASIVLPAGISISPSAANGLEGCSEAEVALRSALSAECPNASKVGTAEIKTPLLESPLEGAVYVAQQEQNPFHTLLALYVVAEGSGVVLKLAGEVRADPTTGQLTTTFAGNPPFVGDPQQPFSSFKLTFFGGPRAALANPLTCGTYTTTGSLAPWSGTPPVTISQSFGIDANCGGGFSPSLVAGTVTNQAGGFSPFTFTLSRSDQDQDFSRLSLSMPPGLLGMLSNVTLCGEPQAAQGTCPATSQIGHVTVGAGPGPEPVFVPQAGKPEDPVFLTGPYNGAPFGLSIVVPAEAGPFNLGRVVVRSAINVDPHTAQITINSAAFPTILQGIPLHVKTINVTIDREDFIFNPTNCDPLTLGATVLSTQGASATLSSRFQAANCASLAFKPKFTASTQGTTSKADGASLDVKIGYPKGAEADIASVKVSLPKQLPSRLTTIQKACTEAAFNANPATCPVASNIGVATARTPVLSTPLTGPVYLVSHGGAAFPDVVMILQGQGVTLDLAGNIDIVKGITTSTFATVPDAPLTSFELKLPEGPHSALASNLPEKANHNFCKTTLTMPTTINAQNGARITQNTKIAVSGCPKTRKATKAKARSKRR
jgi:hypothetical protein